MTPNFITATKCPAGEVYQTCASSCTRTCRDIGIKCTSKCVAGCNCPNGQTLDREGGKCIPVSQCPCEYDGKQYESDQIILQPRQTDGVDLWYGINFKIISIFFSKFTSQFTFIYHAKKKE
jgi:hypothetical protein